MKVRITEFSSKDKVFELAKYITEKYQLLNGIDMKIKFDDREQMMLYMAVDDETVEERYNREHAREFGGPVTDEDIPF